MKGKCLTVVPGIGIILAALFLWLLARPEILGNISRSFPSSEPVTDISTVSFFAQEGDRIRLYFASNIEQGDLDIILYDSEGKQVKELNRAKELVTYLTMRYDDVYTLTAEYKDFAGSFKAEVCAVE